MKITLVSPRDFGYNSKGGAHKKSVTYPGLTLPTLAALVPKSLKASIKIIDEGVDDSPIDFSSDIIAISVLTSSSKRAYEIAEKARKKGCYIVLGGYHVSYNYEEAIKYADTIIIGQADETWVSFLNDYSKGKPKKKYVQIKTPCLTNIPWPRWDLVKKDKYLNVRTIQTSRGCPRNCTFCQVSDNMFASNNRPIDEVIDEIKSLNTKQFMFLDPNFFADEKYSAELMERLKKLRKEWACLSTVNTAKNTKLLRLMKQSGCIGVLVGFETVCQDNLNSMNKRHNQIDNYMDCVSQFHKYGISVLACFVLGFDNDTKETFKATVDFIKKSGIDLIRFSALTPFPGTTLYKELDKQGRIICKDWERYDFQNIVFKPKNMSVEDLYKGLKYCWQETYTYKEILRRAFNAKNHKLLLFFLNLGFRHLFINYMRD